MSVRIEVAPSMLHWVQDSSDLSTDVLVKRFPRWNDWLQGVRQPTLNQIQDLAHLSGIPFGYLLLPEPPDLQLPVADFRDGIGGELRPSPNMLAVVNQCLRRQAWYREYASENGLPAVEVVGTGEGRRPDQVAASMRELLGFEVVQRSGNRDDTRKALLRRFEDLGGLTVATSMVGNNTHRLLDPDEFRGFALVDAIAPLVFVNAAQTLNGQIFTVAHEFAHIWRGDGGVSNEDAGREPNTETERWCNAVASEFLVPRRDLRERFSSVAELDLVTQIERLSQVYRCGTLVVLQALNRYRLVRFRDFGSTYSTEVARLRKLEADRPSSGGNFYANQPFRLGLRLSRAVASDALEGRTTLAEALDLTSLSLSAFDNYAKRIGVA